MTRLITICFALITFPSLGQSDAEFWFSSATKIGLVRDLEASVEEGIRVVNFRTGQTYTDLSLEYNLADFVDASFTWRNSQRPGFWQTDRIVNRMVFDVVPKYSVADWTFSARMRWQMSYRDLRRSAYGHIPDKAFRIRIAVRYDWIKKIKLECGFEDFLSIEPEGAYFDNYRLYGGIKRRFKKYHSFELNYIFHSEFQVRSPEKRNIVSLSYRFDFDKYLSKRRKALNQPQEDKINWYLAPR